MELLFTGELMKADEALALGLVNHVVPESELMSKAEEIAAKILENAPLAVRAMKEATMRGLHLSLPDRLNLAGMVFEQISGSVDAQEGWMPSKKSVRLIGPPANLAPGLNPFF